MECRLQLRHLGIWQLADGCWNLASADSGYQLGCQLQLLRVNIFPAQALPRNELVDRQLAETSPDAMKFSDLPFDIHYHLLTHLDVLSAYSLASAVSSIQPSMIPPSSLLPRETLDNTAAYVLILIIWLRNLTEIEPLQHFRDHQT
jgi:hypothetical protein